MVQNNAFASGGSVTIASPVDNAMKNTGTFTVSGTQTNGTHGSNIANTINTFTYSLNGAGSNPVTTFLSPNWTVNLSNLSDGQYTLVLTQTENDSTTDSATVHFTVTTSGTINLGTAGTFGILASTYTNTITPTIVTGNIGYTLPPTVASNTDGGHTYTSVNSSLYSPAGTDQATALIALNTLACTSNLGIIVDLSQVQGGVYTPGVYCTTGAMSTGTGITLSGSGLYVFRTTGSALDTVVSTTAVTLTNGALASDVFWTPGALTTLGPTSSFIGTVIDPSGITVGANVNWMGRALDFQTTVTTGTADTIIVPGFTASDTTPPVITLTGANPQIITVGGTYTELGATVTDPDNTGLTATIDSSAVITNTIGSYAVTYDAVDPAGNHATQVTRTVNVIAAALGTINLGTANTYGVLGASAVTNSGFTIITGDLGSSPTGTITGFPPGIVTGVIHSADTAATTAQDDALTAYGALSSAACTTTYNQIQELGGLTLTPGVYCDPTQFTITGPATLTLSGAGTYIFNAGSSLTTTTGANIVLTNGATADKVFWRVGSSAILAASAGLPAAQFPGTIIALTSISETGGNANTPLLVVTGRLIALNGDVTFAADTAVTVPSVTIPDTTPPTVSISSPFAGSVINQVQFTISGTATDNVLVDHVIVTVDGGTPVTATGTSTWSTDSGTLSDGIHTIVATSYDAAGNSASQTIYVTVNTVVINTSSTSIASSTGAGPVNSVTDAGNFVSFVPVSESTLPTVGKPVTDTFPYGFSSFHVTGLTLGQTIHVTQTYPSALPANTKYWKIESGVWTDATSLISISGHTLTLTITDGGFGDADGLANGSITDPGGIGMPFSATTGGLGTASTYGVLGATTVTNTGNTVINGDLGLYSGTSITGFFGTTANEGPGTVVGAVQQTTIAAQQAQIDAATAFNGLGNSTCTTTYNPIQELGGLTLTPGVYCDPTQFTITGPATLTLSGAGTYIFNAGSSLTTTTGANIVLTNGATADKVFWRVGSSAILAASAGLPAAQFPGTIIARTSISETGGNANTPLLVVTGRLIALNAEVSFAADTTVTVPQEAAGPLQFTMASGSNSPSESRPSLGGVLLSTFSDGLRINGHVFDVSKFHNPVPQQVMTLDKPVTIIVKETLTRSSSTWQHVMLFMNFNGKDTITGNADTWLALDKHDGVQIHDPHGYLTNVNIYNQYQAYGLNTTFTFTPVKQMSDSNIIIRVWDDRLSQTDAYVMGAILFGTVPTPATPMVKPDWIQVFTNLKDADNAVESAGYLKPEVFAHISSVSQVWVQPNTGHVLWFFNTKDAQAALYIYDSNGNVVGQMMEPLVKDPAASLTGKDTSFAGNHLSIENTDAMNKALALQQLHAQQTIDYLGYNR